MRGTSAGVISSRQLYYRLPEIQIHDVLDKDYRALLDYAPDAKFIDRTEKQTGTPFASETTQQKIDSVFSSLELEDLSKPDQLKDQPDALSRIKTLGRQGTHRSRTKLRQHITQRFLSLGRGQININEGNHKDLVYWPLLIPLSP